MHLGLASAWRALNNGQGRHQSRPGRFGLRRVELVQNGVLNVVIAVNFRSIEAFSIRSLFAVMVARITKQVDMIEEIFVLRSFQQAQARSKKKINRL